MRVAPSGRALLADRLRERGYEIEPDAGRKNRYLELAGVPGTLRAAFSDRTGEVETRIAAFELARGKETRAPKA